MFLVVVALFVCLFECEGLVGGGGGEKEGQRQTDKLSD